MATISSVRATSLTEQRLRIAREADAKAEQANAIVMANGFTLDVADWNSITAEVADLDNDMDVIEFGLHRWMRSTKFRDTITALAINGTGLAAWTQRQNERLSGFLNAPANIIAFKEPNLSAPSKAIEYWRKLLGLTDDQADRLASIDTRSEGAKIADRIASALIDRLQKIHDETISKGTNLSEFIKQVREIAPDASRALLETEYRTHMATVYGEQLHEQIVSRANAFPFTQFFAIIDNRTTDLICRPMGTAGPNGKGYIAASNDPIWIKWRTPCHWRCRSMHSPISYREAQRMGILAADGKTKIAIIGSNPERPFGDPPPLAQGPDGALYEVKPQEGFGGGGSGGSVAPQSAPTAPKPPIASIKKLPYEVLDDDAPKQAGPSPDAVLFDPLPKVTFEDFEKMSIKYKSLFKDWAESLTKVERESLHAYQSSEYHRLNSWLRGLHSESDPDLLARFEKHRNGIDAALAKTQVPEAVTVYRGGWVPPEGDLFVDNGVMSTSLFSQSAERFAEVSGALWEIEVPGGAQGAYVTSIGGTGLGQIEGELLLPRGTRLRILRRGRRIINGKSVVAVLARVEQAGAVSLSESSLRKSIRPTASVLARFVWSEGDLVDITGGVGE